MTRRKNTQKCARCNTELGSSTNNKGLPWEVAEDGNRLVCSFCLPTDAAVLDFENASDEAAEKFLAGADGPDTISHEE